MFALLIGAHLIGDFVLQDHWMQNKSRDSVACTVHVAAYSLPFILLAGMGYIGWVMLWIILVQHWLQDRFSLHLKWMAWFKQSPPSVWPIGPLCVDQALHLGFMWLLVLCS